MHRHCEDPKELGLILPIFAGGEFILKKGRGKDTLVFHGKVDRVVIPDLSQKKILVQSSIVFERWIGGDADFDVKRWKKVDLLSGELPFDYSWYYQQPRHARLKLEFVPEEGSDKKEVTETNDPVEKDIEKKESMETHDRCWLCSHTDPIYRELFRTMLMVMFLKEAKEKESQLKKWRDRLLRTH